MISRRSLLIAAPLVLYSRTGRAWFPHGKVVSSLTPTFSITYHSSWDTNPNGGGGPGTGFTGGTSSGYINGSPIGTWTATQWYNAVNAVFQNLLTDLASYFNSSGTVYVNVGWGSNGGTPVSGYLALNSQANSFTNYAAIKSKLLAIPSDPIKSSAYSHLPGSDPASGTWYINDNWSNIVTNASTSGTVPTVGWSNTTAWDYTPDGSSCHAGNFSLYCTFQHEFTFVALGRPEAAFGGYPAPLDLMTFLGPGTIGCNSFSNSARFFSLDGGTSNILAGTTTNYPAAGSSYDDFLGAAYTGPYVDPTGPGRIGRLTQADFRYYGLYCPLTPLAIAGAGF